MSEVNNKCKNAGSVEDRDAASSTASPLLDTVTEMFKQFHITPESEQNGTSRSNPKENYLFTDKLKQSCYKIAAIKVSDSDQEKYITTNDKNVVIETENGAVVKSQNGFPDNQKEMDSINSVISTTSPLAPINGISLLGSSHKNLEASLLTKNLQDRGNVTSSDIFYFKAPQQLYSTPKTSKTVSNWTPTTSSASKTMSLTSTVQPTETSKSDSKLELGDHNMQASLINSTSVSQMTPWSPIITSSKFEISSGAPSLNFQTSTKEISQNETQRRPIKKGVRYVTVTNPVSSSSISCFPIIESPLLNTPAASSELKSSNPKFHTAQPNMTDLKGKTTPAVDSNATTIMSSISEDTGSVFDKTALMAMFDGSRNLFGTSTVQIPISTDKNSQVSSFPFRNKYAASSELSSKKSSCSQKKLQENSCIANTEFKMIIPTFCKVQRNDTSIYVFGGQENLVSIFDQTSMSPNIFKISPISTTYSFNKTDNSLLQFTIGASPSEFLVKSPTHQQVTSTSNILQKKINLYKYKDYKGALAMFEDAIRLCPDNYTLYTIRAHYYMKLAMYREAIKDIQNVIVYYSSFIDTYICLAKCYIALGDISAADDAVDKARAACGGAEGERASEALRELRTLHIDTQSAVAAQDYARAVASCESFLELCPSNNIKATKAKCLAMLGKTEQAWDIAQDCLRHHATEPEALYAKGLCLYYNFQFPQAMDYFQQVISVFPLHLGAIDSLQKANTLKRLNEESVKACNEGDYEKVIILNNEALKIDKMNKEYNTRLYRNTAAVYERLNKTQLAIEACTAALELKNYAVDRKNRAKYYTQLGQYEDAVRDYEKVYEIEKSVIHEQLLNTAKALVQEKEKAYREMVSSVESLVRDHKFQEAQKLADECLQIRRSDADVLYCKGLCFYYKGQYEEALEYFKKVLNIDPRTHRKAFPQLKKTRSIKVTIKQGDDLYNSDRWVEARCKYRDAKLIDEENWNLSLRMHCKIAETYLKTNEISAAIVEYTSALQFDNNCVEVLRERAKWYSVCEEYEKAILDYRNIYAIDDCEETKLWALNFIKILEGKDAYKKKIGNAESLISTEQYLTTENVELALQLAEECLESDNSDTKALCVKGLCLYYKEQYEQALEQFHLILLLKPRHSTALEKRKKITCLLHTLEKGNDSFKSRRWHDALHSFNEALTIDTYNMNLHVRLFCKKAAIYLELKDLQSAINEYTSALALDDTCAEALRERAKCYGDLKQYENAIEDYAKFYALDNVEITKLWARNCAENLKAKIVYREKLKQAETLIQNRETENVNGALKLAEECLQFNNSDSKALVVKGLCLYYKDQYDQALDQFQQVLLFEPSHPTAFKETRKILCLKSTIEKGNDSFSRGQWQEAWDNFNMALSIDEDHKNLNVTLYCKRAATVRLMGEIHAAIRDYTIALVLDNRCVEALRGRALCYTEVKQYEDAVKDYEKLYAIDQSEEIKQLLSQAKTAYDRQKCRFAQGKAEIGNKLYKRKKFRDALIMLEEAISLDPETAEYYSKTYSCYMNLSMLKEALVVAKKAVALDAKHSQGFDGIAKCYLALGELSGADRAITKASAAGFDCTDDRRQLESLRRLHAQAQKYVEEQNYDRAIACMDQCLQSSPLSSRVKLIKAECLAMLGKIEQALEIADDCIRSNQSDIEALFVKGLCIYYNEKHEQALKYFKEVLRLSPDHGKATAAYKKAKLLQQKKEQGNEEFKMGRYQKAMLLYNQALTVDTTHAKTNAKLHFNKATVYWKLKQTQLAADACTAALELDENYVKALTLRATCFTELKEYDCVVDDYKQIYNIDPSDNIKQLLEKAKRSQNEESLSRNYYTILGVNKTATKPDIIRAYRQLSLMHHPDRHSGRSTFERKRHERRFKEVLEAYTTLSDPVQRRKYDAKCYRVWNNN